MADTRTKIFKCKVEVAAHLMVDTLTGKVELCTGNDMEPVDTSGLEAPFFGCSDDSNYLIPGKEITVSCGIVRQILEIAEKVQKPEHAFKCPECGCTDDLYVIASVPHSITVNTPENVETEIDDFNSEWDDDSRMGCNECDHWSIVKEFKTDAK